MAGFSISPLKAALLGPYIDFMGLGSILALLPYYLSDIGAAKWWIGLILR